MSKVSRVVEKNTILHISCTYIHIYIVSKLPPYWKHFFKCKQTKVKMNLIKKII